MTRTKTKRVKLTEAVVGRNGMVRPHPKTDPRHHYKVGVIEPSGYGGYAINVGVMNFDTNDRWRGETLGEFFYEDELFVIPDERVDKAMELNQHVVKARNLAREIGVM